ncbi:hypothetical protein CR513_19766, partial [Mucuna pruriens]
MTKNGSTSNVLKASEESVDFEDNNKALNSRDKDDEIFIMSKKLEGCLKRKGNINLTRRRNSPKRTRANICLMDDTNNEAYKKNTKNVCSKTEALKSENVKLKVEFDVLKIKLRKVQVHAKITHVVEVIRLKEKVSLVDEVLVWTMKNV